MPVLEAVRQQWEEGSRRFDVAARDPVLRPRLLAQLELVTDELRKRMGQTFSLDELAETYAGADGWVREILEERAAAPGWVRTVTLVQDTAFHLYQRGAVDYMA